MELTATFVGWVGEPTVMLMLSFAVFPPESVTDAVIVWIPLLRVVEKLPPVPIWPSLLEVQTREAVRSKSSGSVALPWKSIGADGSKLEPFTGMVMETAGGASGDGGVRSPKAPGAQTTPSRSVSKVYYTIVESIGAVPSRKTLFRILVRASSG